MLRAAVTRSERSSTSLALVILRRGGSEPDSPCRGRRRRPTCEPTERGRRRREGSSVIKRKN